ncbi:hypothetical protein AX14_007263 [Amanita brunnescens Koide BX004]|nr:hypothetical protein AX14_007263 [Amanita brunnescens Koide BX004]
MRSVIFAALFLIFGTVCAFPVHIKTRADSPSESESETLTIEKIRNAYTSSRKVIASGEWGGLVEITLKEHECQILKVKANPSMMRDMLKEFERLEPENKETRDDYFILEKDFFSSEPPEKPTNVWTAAGEVFDKAWDTCLHRTDPGSFVYHQRSVAVFIGPPTKRNKSAQLKIDDGLFHHILGPAKRIARGPYGELMAATLNGNRGQILTFESRSGEAFNTMVKQLYEAESYVIVKDHYYFFLPMPCFNYKTPTISTNELQEMQKHAVEACNIKWDTLKEEKDPTFLYNGNLKMAVYIGTPYAAIVVPDGNSLRIIDWNRT